MINALHAVRVPGLAEEALRDLTRAREDLRGDLMRARNRLGKLLLRYDLRYDGTWDRWTDRHRAWLAKVEPPERGAQATVIPRWTPTLRP
jgi:transposase